MGPLQKLDAFEIQEAVFAHNRTLSVIGTGILDQHNSPLYPSAIIELVINTYELTKILRHFERPVLSKHDIDEKFDQLENHVSHFRNCVVHTTTTRAKFVDEQLNRFGLNTIRGYAPNAIFFDGESFGCHYQDDTAYLLGPYTLYLMRHILFVHRCAAHWLSNNGIERFIQTPLLDELLKAELTHH